MGISILIVLGCSVVAAYLQIIIHEGGHLIFGLLTGYRFVSFRVGSLMLYRQNRKLKLGKYSLAGTGGQCLLAPPDLKNGKIPCVLYNLGGALMNLLVSLICVGIVLWGHPGKILVCFHIAMAVIGILFAITNGIPMRLGGIDNDGYNALSLGKNPEALRSIWVQLKTNEQLLEGIRLKDMPEEWFAIPSDEDMKNSMVSALGVFACNRLMDEHEFEKANILMYDLMRKENGIMGIHSCLMTLDRIYCELINGNVSKLVEKMQNKDMKKFMKAMKQYPSILRTQHAYALLWEKDCEKAEVIKVRFEKIGKTYPYAADVASERELIEIAEEVYRNTKLT